MKAWSIFTGSAVAMMVETTDSDAELADSTNNSVIVSQLHQLNMFILLNPLELANGNVYSSESNGNG